MLNAAIAAGLTFAVTNLVPGTSFVSLFVKAFICLILPNVYFLAVYSRKKEFKQSVVFIRDNILTKLGKNGG